MNQLIHLTHLIYRGLDDGKKLLLFSSMSLKLSIVSGMMVYYLN